MRGIGAHLLRHAVATAAPALVSLAHLVVQLSMAHRLDATGFGILATLLTVIQFGFSLSNALVATPYTIAVNRSEGPAATDLFVGIDALLLLSGALAVALLVALLGGSAIEAVGWSLASAFGMLRWFCRSHAYAVLRPMRAAVSDLVYVAVLLAGLGLGYATDRLDLSTVAFAMAAAALAGSAAVGDDLIRGHTRWGGLQRLAAYADVWRDQSRWTLLGVATTEATNNSHTYLVAAIAGPASLAPIALAGLLVKPVTLAITSLTQLERAVMAGALHAGDEAGLARAVLLLRLSLVAVWVVMALAMVAILGWAPGLLVGPAYDMAEIRLAAALWAAIALAQCLQTPGSVLLQAMAEFRILSAITIWTGLLSVVLAVVMTAAFGAVQALIGTLAGATATFVACEWIARSRRRAKTDGSRSPR